MALDFFLRLLLGHVIGDFWLQPYWLALAKRKGWTGLIVHVSVVTLFTAIMVWWMVPQVPNWWVWMIVLFVGHLFIDQFRTFVFTDNSKGKGLVLLVLDQIAHVILIALIAWAATGWTFTDLYALSDTSSNEFRMMVYLIGLSIFIWVAPILEVETAVAVLAMQGTEIKELVAIEQVDRVVGSIERTVAALLFVVGWGILSPLVFIPRVGIMIYNGDLTKNRTIATTKLVMSFVIALAVSAFLVVVPVPIFT